MDPLYHWSVAIMMSALLFSVGWHKFNSPAYYRDLIGRYTGVHAMLAAAAARVLAVVEISAAILLLLPGTRVAAAWGVTGLLSVYTLLIAVSLWRGLDMDCGCSGPLARQRLSPWLLLRNAVLLLLAWMLTLPGSGRALGVTDCLVILCAGFTLLCIYLACEQLLSNRDKLILLRSQ